MSSKANNPAAQSRAVRDLIGRLREVLAERWGRNVAAMSRDTGVSHAALSRVFNFSQTPSVRLLLALAKTPGVNMVHVMGGGPQTVQACIDGATWLLAEARRLSST